MEKISLGAYVLHTQSHTALLTSTRLILVDTAMEESSETLLEEIKKCGYQPKDIETIVITHSHIDHIGGLATAKSHMESARVACHKIEVDSITQQVEGTFDDLLVDGQVYQGLLVIHTPGHTKGNISLLDQEADLLIVGDSFRTEEGTVHPMPDNYNQDPEEHRRSMKKLLDYQFEKAIVAHGHPIHSTAHKLLENATKSF
jgi:glyoxylase-like metal-dependent hydrolase (beta-lactamase superfamily II)